MSVPSQPPSLYPTKRALSAAVVLFGPATRLTDDAINSVAPLVVQSADEIANRMR